MITNFIMLFLHYTVLGSPG